MNTPELTRLAFESWLLAELAGRVFVDLTLDADGNYLDPIAVIALAAYCEGQESILRREVAPQIYEREAVA